MFKLNSMVAGAVLAFSGFAAQAEDWTLDAEASQIAFGSVKSNEIGEVHTFKEFSGSASDGGAVGIEINLASVETLIDIRNERMIEFVFQNAPTARISAQIDMEEVNGLGVGESTVIIADGVVSLVGNEIELDGDLFVMRLSEDKVLVSTDGMIMMNIEDAGLTAGIDKLKEIAGLDVITRVSPVTLRLIFDRAS
ncbi:MAG: YceI family protein [Pseudomonadota bacterium]